VADRGLRLSLVGRFEVVGHLDAPIPGGRAARLLKVLAVQQGRYVPLAELIEVLWPDTLPQRPDRIVASLVSRLRHSLGPGRLDGDSGGYRLVRDRQTEVDLLDAEQLVVNAEQEIRAGQHGYAAVAAEQAVRLLTAGTTLADEPAALWVENTRRHVRELVRRARTVHWDAALELGECRAAISAAEAARSADPLDEAAARALMRAYAAAGEQAAALRVYESLRASLADELGVDPSGQTTTLFRRLLSRPGPADEDGTRTAELRPAPPTLVGRARELDAINALWSGAMRGRGGMAVVLGEAGIGKSALLSALIAKVERTGGLVVTTSCFEAEHSLYLQPLVEAVGRVVGRFDLGTVREIGGEWVGQLSQLVPRLARTVDAVPQLRATPEIEHRRNLEAITELLLRTAERQPLLLLVEDMQNAGQSTVEALHFLASRLGTARLLTVVTERSVADPPRTAMLGDVATVLRLERLTRSDVHVLVAHAGVRYQAEELYQLTGGSPLFLTELIRHGRRVANDDAGELVIPESLHQTVSARLAAIGDDVRDLLQQGAVLGGSFLLDDVAALTGASAESLALAAERALRMGLLVEQDTMFKFANDIVRKVAYASVPRPVLVSRHRRAAKLLADQPEAAAHQLVAADDWGAAAQAWLRAAEVAHLDFANKDAERLLGNALRCATRAGEQRTAGQIHLRRAKVRADLGRLADAREDCEAAVAIATEIGDEELESYGLEQLGWTALYARDALGATDLAERASHLAESAAAAPAARPSSLLLLGRVRHWDGDYDGAASAYDRALDSAAGSSATATVLAYRGALLQHMDRFAEARSVLQRAVVMSREAGEFRLLLQALFFCGLARGDLGDFDGALRALGRALRLIDEFAITYYRAGILSTSSWLWREIGDLGRAREHAEEAIELAHRGGGALELEQELHALLALADCELALGCTDEAAALVDRAVPMLDRSLPFRPRALLRMLEMRSRFDPALAEELLVRSRQHSSTKYEALALRHLGRPVEAATMAAATGSDLVIAELGAPDARRAALERITAALPGELKETFVAGGRLLGPQRV
jgi:DNA-binding SARP family transcriptional activator/tetratricopeptide (TPR) repeat protein